jgi:hypothetical protein
MKDHDKSDKIKKYESFPADRYARCAAKIGYWCMSVLLLWSRMERAKRAEEWIASGGVNSERRSE